MSSEPSKTITPPAPAWSPDQPLRADATDVQIILRHDVLYFDEGKTEREATVQVAHELLRAAVPSDETPAKSPSPAEPTPTREQIEALPVTDLLFPPLSEGVTHRYVRLDDVLAMFAPPSEHPR